VALPTADENWIDTEVRAAGLVVWRVVRTREVIHSGEHSGDDAAGSRAFEIGLAWANEHCPGVSFHWRHRSLTVVSARTRKRNSASGSMRVVASAAWFDNASKK
jgi:hypothetical protein